MALVSRAVRGILSSSVDIVVAVVLVAFELFAVADAVPEADAARPVDGLAWVLAVVAAAPLVVRRRHPVGVLVATAGGLLGYMVLGYAPALHGYPLLVAIYTLASLRSPRTSLLGVLPAVAASVWATTHYAGEYSWQSVVADFVLIVAAWSLGDSARSRRLRAEELAERVHAVESARRAETEQAVANERLRIARELHDVMAHSMSVIAVQAGLGRHVVREDVETAEKTLDVIAETSRRTLTEMRQMVGVLRVDDDASRVPQPGLAALDDLLVTARRAGLVVTLTITGEARELAAGLDLAAFRILQEALTNAAKHAGAGSHVRIALTWAADALTIDVRDDGAGVRTAPVADDGHGHGLIGVRERVALFGGSVETTPQPGGGFVVHATLPLAAHDQPMTTRGA